MKLIRSTDQVGPARSTRWPQAGLIVAIVVLAVAGLALLGTYFYLSRQTVADTGWVDPQAGISASDIAPDIAVLTLAGEPDDRIIRAALDAGEREAARAALAYSVLLPDTVRSGQWLILANAYQDTDPSQAGSAYQAAVDLSSLGPTLGDLARAEISLQAARSYVTLEKAWLGALLVAQAENIARYSPILLPAQRRQLLAQVATAYERTGDGESAGRIRANLAAYSAGPGLPTERSEPLLPTLRGAVVLPEEVVTAISGRQQAAATMAARWLGANEADREVLAGKLGEALAQEDAARKVFYDTAGSLSEADALAMLHDRINWLTIKLRVARGAFGASLVPAWEDQEGAIATELAAAYTDLINGYGRQLDTLDTVEALSARVELLRQGVLWIRLGLFPDHAAEEALARQLTEASRELWERQGSAGLAVVSQVERGLQLYLLSGSNAREGS